MVLYEAQHRGEFPQVLRLLVFAGADFLSQRTKMAIPAIGRMVATEFHKIRVPTEFGTRLASGHRHATTSTNTPESRQMGTSHLFILRILSMPLVFGEPSVC